MVEKEKEIETMNEVVQNKFFVAWINIFDAWTSNIQYMHRVWRPHLQWVDGSHTRYGLGKPSVRLIAPLRLNRSQP